MAWLTTTIFLSFIFPIFELSVDGCWLSVCSGKARDLALIAAISFFAKKSPSTELGVTSKKDLANSRFPASKKFIPLVLKFYVHLLPNEYLFEIKKHRKPPFLLQAFLDRISVSSPILFLIWLDLR